MIKIGARRQLRARIWEVVLRELFYFISEQVLYIHSTGNSRDSFPSKAASDKGEMQLEIKETKPSKLFRGSKADKGNCKAK